MCLEALMCSDLGLFLLASGGSHHASHTPVIHVRGSGSPRHMGIRIPKYIPWWLSITLITEVLVTNPRPFRTCCLPDAHVLCIIPICMVITKKVRYILIFLLTYRHILHYHLPNALTSAATSTAVMKCNETLCRLHAMWHRLSFSIGALSHTKS
jgi:hypothetical protein